MKRGREGWTETGGEREGGRLREDDDERKGLKKRSKDGEKGDKGQGSLMKAPLLLSQLSYSVP